MKIDKELYSIKMRGASPVNHKKGGNHISGAERIINYESLKDEILNLIDRALTHPKGRSDFINISIQKIHDTSNIIYINPLNIKTLSLDDDENIPYNILKLLGFSYDKSKYAMDLLLKQSNLKGALIVSFDTLKEFHDHITRCVNMDYDSSIKEDLDKFLNNNNFLGKYLKDALCLSSKICNHKNVLCEICISDDPNYKTGYISSKALGYIRINNLKPHNHKCGGRIIFIKDENKLNETIDYLKNSIVIINSIPKII